MMAKKVAKLKSVAWSVKVIRQDGSCFVAHAGDGLALYALRDSATAVSKRLRERGFRCRVVRVTLTEAKLRELAHQPGDIVFRRDGIGYPKKGGWFLHDGAPRQALEDHITCSILLTRIDIPEGEASTGSSLGACTPVGAHNESPTRCDSGAEPVANPEQQRGDPSNDPKNPCYGSAANSGAETVSSREGSRAAAPYDNYDCKEGCSSADGRTCEIACDEAIDLRGRLAAANERIVELENNVYDHQPTYDALNELFNSVGTAEEQRACGRSVKERCEFIRKRATLQPLPKGAELFVPSGGGLTTNGEFHPFLRKVDPATFGIPEQVQEIAKWRDRYYKIARRFVVSPPYFNRRATMTSELTELHKRYTALMEERNGLDARVAALEDGIRKACEELRRLITDRTDVFVDTPRTVHIVAASLAALLPQEKSGGK